jgi:hypothetical protein
MGKNMQAANKVTITERALFQRINRKLQQQLNPEMLRTARTDRQRDELGTYFTVDAGTRGQPGRAVSRGVGLTNVDLEKLARKLGVLQPWEEMEKEEK